MSNTIGTRIQFARVKGGLSREHVAVACGVTSRTVQNWENDDGDPGLRHAEALCKVLGISPSKLIFGREKKGRAA